MLSSGTSPGQARSGWARSGWARSGCPQGGCVGGLHLGGSARRWQPCPRLLRSKLMPVTSENLKAFLGRPWDRLRALRDQYTAGVLETEGAGALLEMGDALRAHAEVCGATVSAQARSDDLLGAVGLRRLLDRASRAEELAQRTRHRPVHPTDAGRPASPPPEPDTGRRGPGRAWHRRGDAGASAEAEGRQRSRDPVRGDLGSDRAQDLGGTPQGPRRRPCPAPGAASGALSPRREEDRATTRRSPRGLDAPRDARSPCRGGAASGSETRSPAAGSGS